MDEALIAKIQNNPKFIQLEKNKSTFSWTLSIIMLLIYYGFILVIAFSPATLATPINEGGVTTIGIPIGLAVIFSAVILTGIYVRRANSEFDQLTQAVVEDAQK